MKSRKLWQRLALTSSLFLGACAVEYDPSVEEDVRGVEQFAVWSPGSALMDEHRNWHAGGRSDTNTGRDFLRFHRDFLQRLRTEFERQGLTHNIKPWYTLPAAMRDSANGWNSALQTAYDAIRSQIDPATGVRFTNLNAYGMYLENNLHNSLHGIASRAYGEVEVSTAPMSPSSTYFFKIHGFVEYYHQKFIAGDFTQDGQSDLVLRDSATGVNQIWTMNGDVPGTITDITARLDTTCSYKIGATADINYDGHTDLIWESSACRKVDVWYMSGRSRTATASLPSQSADLRLIGSGDFDQDLRPDLAWRNGQNQLVIWPMKGTALKSAALTFSMPATPIAVLDADDDGIPDVLLKEGSGDYKVQFLQAGPALGSVVTTFSLSPYHSIGAVGRFNKQAHAADLIILADSPSLAPEDFYRLRKLSNTPTYSTAGTWYDLEPDLRPVAPR